MDGLYEFNINSPMGNMKALINIVTNGNTFSGYVDVMGKRTEFKNGTISGENLYVTGSFAAKLMSIKYNIVGRVQNNILYINAQTNMGNFNLQGNKIQ